MYNTWTLDLFYNLFESYLYLDSSESFFSIASSLYSEFFLILAIFFYLCFVKNFNNFYINSLYFYFVLFIELFLITYTGLSFIYSGNYTSQFFFYSCLTVDFYSTFCKFFIIIFLILISAFSEFKFT